MDSVDRKHNWKTKSVHNTYDNPWIRVEHHEVINPSGHDGIYGKVHFKNLAIGIIPLTEDRHTWLVGQYRYPLDQFSWEIPMGGGPVDLDPLLSAQKELKEETGLEASDWKVIMKVHTSNSVTDEVGLVYLAQDLTQGTPDTDETEELEVRRVPFEQAYQMVLSGEITDVISVAGILKVRAKGIA